MHGSRYLEMARQDYPRHGPGTCSYSCTCDPAAQRIQHSSSDSWGPALGHIWVQHLRKLHLEPDSTLVEIGPGFSAKIGFGLAELGFCGALFLVEPNGSARRWAQREYQRLLPAAQVRTSHRAVPDADLPTEGPVDAIIANHVLDDLLMSYFISAPENDRIFGHMRPGVGCPEKFSEIWREILGSSRVLHELVDRVVEDVVHYIDVVQSDRLILNEYLSWHHRCCGLGRIHRVSLWTLGRLKQRLMATGQFSTQLFWDSTEAMQWLVAERLTMDSDNFSSKIIGSDAVGTAYASLVGRFSYGIGPAQNMLYHNAVREKD